MAGPRNTSLLFALLIVTVGLVSALIVLSAINKLFLPLPLYFFILLVCDLGATALLTTWMRSSAEWNGKVLNGNLRITGSAVVFLLILWAGFKFRPTPKDDPVVLTVILFDPSNAKHDFRNDTMQVTLGNLVRTVPVNEQGEAVFLDVDSRYLGQPVALNAKLDRYRISSSADTTVTLPGVPVPVIRLPVFPADDSSLFEGLVLSRHQARASLPIAGAVLHFPSFNRTVVTDSLGQFAIYLKAKDGDVIAVKVSKQQRWIYTGEVALTKNAQILADE